jgi:hypothetical protein
MSNLISKKERDYALKNYTFKCRKKSNYSGEFYVKTYEFDVSQTLHTIFSKFYNYDINLTKEKCDNSVKARFATRRDKKTEIIVPTIKINKIIKPQLGTILKKDDDEVIVLFSDLVEYLEKTHGEVLQRKYESDYKNVKTILYDMAKQKFKETPKIKELQNRIYGLAQEQSKLNAEIYDLSKETEHTNIVDICKEIRNNAFDLPKNEIERVMCSQYEFDNQVIINTVNELIIRYEEETNEPD